MLIKIFCMANIYTQGKVIFKIKVAPGEIHPPGATSIKYYQIVRPSSIQ